MWAKKSSFDTFCKYILPFFLILLMPVNHALSVYAVYLFFYSIVSTAACSNTQYHDFFFAIWIADFLTFGRLSLPDDIYFWNKAAIYIKAHNTTKHLPKKRNYKFSKSWLRLSHCFFHYPQNNWTKIAKNQVNCTESDNIEKKKKTMFTSKDVHESFFYFLFLLLCSYCLMGKTCLRLCLFTSLCVLTHCQKTIARDCFYTEKFTFWHFNCSVRAEYALNVWEAVLNSIVFYFQDLHRKIILCYDVMLMICFLGYFHEMTRKKVCFGEKKSFLLSSQDKCVSFQILYLKLEIQTFYLNECQISTYTMECEQLPSIIPIAWENSSRYLTNLLWKGPFNIIFPRIYYLNLIEL